MNEQNLILIEFKKLLKAGRLRSGYNYKQLAHISEISDQSLRKYENDPHTDIPLNKLFHLFKIIKVPQDKIVELVKIFY